MGARPLALVTGGSGVVGPPLIRRLAAAGYRVRSLSRTPPPEGLVPAGTDVVVGDVTDPAAVRQAVRGARVVCHLAAMLHRTRSDAPDPSAYRAINVEGTRLVRDAAAGEGVARLVFFSTINVYGPSVSGVVWDEDSALSPATPYARTKAEAEEVVRDGRDGLDSVVLRLAAVYGPRMRGNYVALARALRAGWFVPVGQGESRRTLVHVEDAAAAAVLAAEDPRAGGAIYNVTDGGVHALSAVIEAMCRALGRRPPRVRLPERPLRAAIGVARRIPGLGAPAARAGALLDKLLEDVAVSGARLQALGYRPAFDLRTGWQDALGDGDPVRGEGAS